MRRAVPPGGRWRLTPEMVTWSALPLLVTGGLLAIWPVASSVPPAPPAFEGAPVSGAAGSGESVADAVARARASELATQVVRSNVFSARRRAPTVRYRDPLAAPPPELADIPTAGADGLAAGGAGGTGADEGPRLLGIASVAGVWQALVQWAPGRPAVWCAVAARCVDGDGGGRVRAIAPDAVDLVVAGRVRTLRLAPRRATDSLSRVP